ncbi:four helix bundle protein [Candidatus Pacebacteria bacterium]|nr:four helix bundle protein [Candidatus Paceibacterota bacterium]
MEKTKYKSFEDIQCWQKSKILSVQIYKTLQNNRDFSFRDQMQRAAVSVMNNIVEGSERNSYKEFRQFLYVAKASCGEVRSMLYLAKELGYVSEDEFTDLRDQAVEISKMLSGFIKALDF